MASSDRQHSVHVTARPVGFLLLLVSAARPSWSISGTALLAIREKALRRIPCTRFQGFSRFFSEACWGGELFFLFRTSLWLGVLSRELDICSGARELVVFQRPKCGIKGSPKTRPGEKNGSVKPSMNQYHRFFIGGGTEPFRSF